MGSHTSVSGKGPESFSIRVGDTNARINARSDEVQRIIDYFKQWLPRVNMVYKKRLNMKRGNRKKSNVKNSARN